MNRVSFFTPIKYSNHSTTSIRQKMTEIVDEYFYLRGQVALVIPEKSVNGSERVELQPGKAIGWQSALKVGSYMICFFNVLITSQFPLIAANRRVVQFQRILNFLPLFMLIAKVVLRSTSRFHEVDSKDLIPPQVKDTLDDLFGGTGSVNRLPVYDKDRIVLNAMTAPIMKAIAVNPSNGKSNPYILIKMRRLSSEEEVKIKFPDYLDYVYKRMDKVIVLKPLYIEEPLMWGQDNATELSPTFFKGKSFVHEDIFTSTENGKLLESQTKAFTLLKNLIKEGKGEDINGIRWEIIGHIES